MIYDYIIVGAGSAGAIVAERLSANGRHQVLLLEAGPSDRRFWIQTPLGYGISLYDPKVNWRYWSEPIAGLANRKTYVPRGKVLGGSSSINAMVYIRGQAEDFEDWKAAGNPGWGWEDIRAVYERIEGLRSNDGPEASPALGISTIDDQAHPLCRAFFQAGQEAGLALNRDFNGATQEGVGHYRITARDGYRQSSARAFLWPAMKRPNLTIVTQAQATGIGFEGKRAVSVAYRRNGQVETARAGREIILSAGAIGSPQLLQLSGVGPAALLQRYGIAPLQDSPAVGRHMQDHLCYDHVYRANQPSLNEILRPWAGRLKIGLQYLLTRRGPLSLSVNQGGGFARSRPDATRPDIQFYFAPLSFDQTPPGKRIADPFPGFYLSLSPCRPVSRGYVEIRSTDPDQAPAIQPNILAEPEDAAVALAGARWLEKLARQPGLARIIDAELKPGLPERSDAAVLADIRARAYSVFHPCGSCRMGPDPAQAAVDAKLRVHGLAGLRVIDASVFPYVTAGNINAPSIAVGGRGADLILAEA